MLKPRSRIAPNALRPIGPRAQMIQFFWFVHYVRTVRIKTILKLYKGKYKPIKPIG